MSDRPSEPIHVMIVDDKDDYRHSLRTLVETAPDMTVVAEATSGEMAIEMARQHSLDVILMDIDMPSGMSGIEATRQIVYASPNIRVLMLTILVEDRLIFDALGAGAYGYVEKTALKAELHRAIRGVYAGEAIFSSAVAVRLRTYFATIKPFAAPNLFPELSEREREVLDLMAQGLENEVIAHRLTITPKTVRNHVSNILSKLQVSSRIEAIIRARESGPGKP